MNKPPLKRLPTSRTPIQPPPAEKRLEQAQEWALEAAETPWENAHPRVKVGYALRMPEVLYLKVKYLSENMPNTSMHKFIIDAIEEKVNKALQPEK